MAIKVCGCTVIDNSRNVCANSVCACCMDASTTVTIPSGTTACRPTGATGQIYFDTDEGSLIAHDGTDWAAVGGSAGINVEQITSNADDAWSIYSNNLLGSTQNCRRYRADIHGCKMYEVCNPQKYSAYTNQCQGYRPVYHCTYGLGSCEICMFNSESNKFVCCRVCRARHVCQLFCSSDFWIGNSALNTGKCCQNNAFVCANQSFPITPTAHGQAHLTAFQQRYHYNTSACLTGGCCWNNFAEYYFDKKGGVSMTHNITPYLCLLTLSCAARSPLGAFAVPRYGAQTIWGRTAFLRVPLSSFDAAGVSENLCRCAHYIVTSDTFGTGLEEACDFALVNCGCPQVHTNNRKYFPTNIGPQSCGRLSPLLVDTVGSCTCCVASVSPPICQACFTTATYQLLCCHLAFYNSRTDIFGGGGLHRPESFCNSCASFADGLCHAAYDSKCCLFAVLGFDGAPTGCKTPAMLPLQDGFMFLSKDGTKIHRIFSCCLSCTGTTACCCNYAGTTGTSRDCFGTYYRLYQTDIDRVNQCVAAHKGFCCHNFLDWEKDVLGCTDGTHSPRNDYSLGIFQLRCILTLGAKLPNTMRNDITCKLWFSDTGDSFCIKRCLNKANLDEGHHAIWSKVCSNKAIFFGDNSCGEYHVAIFDCCEDRLERSVNLSYSFGKCAEATIQGLIGTWGTKPCYFNLCGNTDFATWFGNGNWCTFRDCLCTVTGNPTLSYMQKCLGYTMHAGACLQCHCMMPIGGDDYGSVVFNPENDHLVFFRSIGYILCNQVLKCITWMGAICWDIHNNCVSKINTIWPPKPDVMQYLCKQDYDEIQCAINCSSYSLSRHGCVQYRPTCGYTWTFNCCCSAREEGISALPYGNVNTYRESGCTDLGGFYIAAGLGCNSAGGSDGFTCISRCGVSSCTCYYECTAAACCICGCMCGNIMCMNIMGTYAAKVPFTKPLECVGWRSEPELAKMFNSIFAPRQCSCYITNLMPYGGDYHKILARCVCCRTASFGSQKVCQNLDCWNDGPYGTYDCMSWVNTVKVVKPCCNLQLCCCAVTGFANGFCVVPLDCIIQCGGKACKTCVSMYKNIKPCHLNPDETSKRYIYPYIESKAPVVPHRYDRTDRLDGRYIPLNSGESPHENFHRLWNETVICCC